MLIGSDYWRERRATCATLRCLALARAEWFACCFIVRGAMHFAHTVDPLFETSCKSPDSDEYRTTFERSLVATVL